MKKRFLRKLEVSPIGMGCMGFSHGYGDIPEESYSIEAIQKAYEFGCTFFDTAEGYAPNMLPEGKGHNEKILGKAVKNFRQKIVLATKFVLTVDEIAGKNIVDVIKSHLEISLKNLQTDYVDLYYLHRVNPEIPVEKIAEAMGKIIDAGIIRGWGLSQVAVDTIKKANEIAPLAAVQNIYSMIERSIEAEVIPYCLENNIGVVPFSPIASGFLSGKVTTQTDFSHSDDVRKFVPQLKRENIEANQPILDLIKKFAESKNATPAQISLAWMLKKYKNVVPIPGSKNQGRILENLGAWNVNLSDEEFSELDSALNKIPVAGFRGHVEMMGDSMKNWDRKK